MTNINKWSFSPTEAPVLLGNLIGLIYFAVSQSLHVVPGARWLCYFGVLAVHCSRAVHDQRVVVHWLSCMIPWLRHGYLLELGIALAGSENRQGVVQLLSMGGGLGHEVRGVAEADVAIVVVGGGVVGVVVIVDLG